MVSYLSQNPIYEIWGCDYFPDRWDEPFGNDEFRQDCCTYEDAVKARAYWQGGGRAAWIVDKETGEVL